MGGDSWLFINICTLNMNPLLWACAMKEGEAATTSATTELVDALQGTTAILPEFVKIDWEGFMGLVAFEEKPHLMMCCKMKQMEGKAAEYPIVVPHCYFEKMSNMDHDHVRASLVIVSFNEAFGLYRKQFYDHMNIGQQHEIMEFFHSYGS